MKSTVDTLEGLSRKVNVQVPAEKVQKAFEKVYKAIQQKANIKGFRPGKAPLATIKAMYADQVKSDVVNDLINETYASALAEHRLDPIGYPRVSFEPIAEDLDFQFSCEIEVRPEVTVKNYEGLSVLREKVTIDEDRVNTVLESIRSGQAETVAVFDDRALTQGDIAVVDFEGTVDGAPLPGGSATGHELEIGSNNFIDGFEEGLIGMKIAQERTLNLKFPEGYHEASLSGAPVTFKTKLTGIKRKSLPALDDELAKKAGDHQTLDELKERIRKDLMEGEQRRAGEDMKNRVVRALVDANPVDAPRALVDQQKKALTEDFKGRLKEQGMTESDFEEYKVKWDQEFEQSATFMVKSTFLLDALAEKLNLRATDAEVDQKIDEYAKQTGIELARLNEFYETEDRRARLSFQVTEEKVVNHLLSKAKVTEVSPDQLAKD